jgi:phage terminase small subunit
MPRKRSPITVINFDNKSKRSKKELEARAACEIKIGDQVLQIPDSVKADETAREKWLELKKLYSDIDYVTSADVDIFEQYCLSYSELQYLRRAAQEYKNDARRKNKKSYEIALALKDIDRMINVKSEALRKIGASIFLDPTSRIKAIPLKKKEPPKNPLEAAGFNL